MSEYDIEHLHETTIHGMLNEREKAWHLAGIDVADAVSRGLAFPGPVPVDAVNRLLGWTPEEYDAFRQTKATRTVYVPAADGTFVPEEIPVYERIVKQYGKGAGKGRKAIYGPNNSFIEIHGEKYNTLAGYSELLNFAMLLTDGEADIYSAGCPGWGDIGWVQVVLRETIKCGHLTLRPDIIIGSSLDGSTAERTKYTTVLTVCDNTFSLAQQERIGKAYSLKHTLNARRNVSQARQHLDLAWEASNEFATQFDNLANESVTDRQFKAIVADIINVPEEDGRGRTMALNAHSRLNTLWTSDERVAPFSGSVAGVVQAFNTYAHWVAPTRGNTDRLERQASRALAGDDGTPLEAILQSWERHKVLVG